jgi:hypothetical protein
VAELGQAAESLASRRLTGPPDRSDPVDSPEAWRDKVFIVVIVAGVAWTLLTSLIGCWTISQWALR